MNTGKKIIRFIKSSAVPVALILAAVLIGAQSNAKVISEYDQEGKPVYIDEEVAKSPDRFITKMKTELRRGNLDIVCILGKILSAARPDDQDVRAMHSICICIAGDVNAAEAELDEAVKGKKRSFFSLVAEGMIKQREKDNNSALRLSEKALSIDNSHPYPWNIKGKVHMQQGKYKQALADFKMAVKLEPDFQPGFQNLGVTSYMQGDFTGSVSFFKRAMALNPDAENIHYGLGLAFEALGQFDLAAEELSRHLDIMPGNHELEQKIGELLIRAGQYDAAIKTGHKLMENGLAAGNLIAGDAALKSGNLKDAAEVLLNGDNLSPEVNYLLGYCFSSMGQHEKGLEYFERTLKLKKNHFGAYAARAGLKLYLDKSIDPGVDLKNQWADEFGKVLDFISGCSLASQGGMAQALKEWQAAEWFVRGFSMTGIDEAALSKGLESGEAKHICLGVLYYLKELPRQAVSEFEKALHINSGSILSNYWAAMAYLKLGDKENAINSLIEATKNAPEFFAALYTIGELSFLNGDTDSAVKYYERAVNVKKDVGVLVKLGMIFEKAGDFDKAEKYYMEITHLSPDLYLGYNQLAWLFAKRGVALDRAMNLAKRANKLQPGNKSILDTIGWIDFHKKNYSQALKNVEAANRIGPGDPTVLYHIGAIHNAMGNRPAAKEYLEKALEISNSFDEADDARKLLNP